MNPPELRWIKASCSQSIGACVEFAANGDMVSVRDSKNPEVLLNFTRQEVLAFIDGARRGEFDHLAG